MTASTLKQDPNIQKVEKNPDYYDKTYGNTHQQVEDYETIIHSCCVLYNTSTVINKGYNHARLERPCSNSVLEKPVITKLLFSRT